jgi:site-specific recombinase XerD
MNLEVYLNSHLQKSTAKNYCYHINKFILLNRNTEQYNYKKLMEYLEELRKTYPPNTLKTILFALKKYYAFLIETGVRKDNPAQSIKFRDAKEAPIQHQDLFTDKECNSF